MKPVNSSRHQYERTKQENGDRAAQLKQWFSSGGNPIYIPRKTRYKNAKKRK